MDNDDYVQCIKGFLHISQDLIYREQKENNIEEDLSKYFFNKKIETLSSNRKYLLGKIHESFKAGQITDEKNEPLDEKSLTELRKEIHLSPFLDW
jgi:hypothetical protein